MSKLLLIFILIFSFGKIISQNKNKVYNSFKNDFFIKEEGQFEKLSKQRGFSFDEEVFYGVETEQFKAYFVKDGVLFYFSEYERKTEGEESFEKEEDKKTFNTIWHKAKMKWQNTNSNVEVKANNELSSYMNYECQETPNSLNKISTYSTLNYQNIYDGVDLQFSFSKEGGLKYDIIIAPHTSTSNIKFVWEGVDDLKVDKQGILQITKEFNKNAIIKGWELKDKAPVAYSSISKREINTGYKLDGNEVSFNLPQNSGEEGIVIDPTIINPAFPDINRAYDIETDENGNIYIYGNYSEGATEYQIKKYDPLGNLLWTYSTYSIFLGDFAVDNPGNVYIIGGYSAGKRQKLNTAGVQQWTLAGLVEEWRLSFDKSKTNLTVGGYFTGGLGNIAKMNLTDGSVTDNLDYALETRGVSTDCNGDVYSLHVTFGANNGATATNTLRKTNSDFTAGGNVTSGFTLAEASAVGYAYNPDYNVNIYQGVNGVTVLGDFVYVYDGLHLRKYNKETLAFITSTIVPNGSEMECSGVAYDFCSNLYIGTTSGIVKLDTLLNQITVIPTPSNVYDIILANNGSILVSGNGFFGEFETNCALPQTLSVTETVLNCESGSATLVPVGGSAGYSYLWTDNGETTDNISNLSAGIYNYEVTDAFCNVVSGSIEIDPLPTASIEGDALGIAGPTILECNDTQVEFNSNSIITDGNITSWKWHFGFGDTITQENPIVTFPIESYPNLTTYDVFLEVTTADGCKNNTLMQYTPLAIPTANFSFDNSCVNTEVQITNESQIVVPDVINDYLYYFGDNTAIDNDENPLHTYSLAGEYDIQLNVISNNGCSHDTTFTIVIYPEPVANFSSSTVCENEPSTVFTNLSEISSGSIISSNWDFGTGSSSLYNPSYNFLTAGIYDVSLEISSNFGCENNITIPIEVLAKPTAELTVDLQEGCSEHCVEFTDLSIPNSTSISIYNWDFDLDEPSFDQNPSICFDNPSNEDDITFSTELIVTNDLGCKDTILKEEYITVFHNPIAHFETSSLKENELEASFNMDNLSTGADTYSWSFGDGNLSNEFEPTNSYADTGAYVINLVTATDHNCLDSTNLSINVVPLISIYLPNTFTPNSDGVNDVFEAKGRGIDESNFELYIFDKWGTQIFFSNNMDIPWDGTYKGQLAKQDVYVYKVICSDFVGEVHEFKGHVNLLK